MKRKLAIILLMCLVTGIFNGTTDMPVVKAEEVQEMEIQSDKDEGKTVVEESKSATVEEDFKYVVDGVKGYARITGYEGIVSDVTIPEMLQGYPVKSVEGFAENLQIERVTFPDTIQEISEKCFSDCTNLKEVILPSKLTSIPTRCFYNCTSLTDIKLPESLTVINANAFDGCVSLREIKFPERLQKIEYGAFSRCSRITSVTIPEKVIELSGFEECTQLQEVILPDTLSEIGGFSGCTSLKKIRLPKQLKKINTSAFENSGIEDITIPSSVSTIEGMAFYNCKNLKSVTIMGNNTSVGEQWSIYGSAFEYCSNLTQLSVWGNGEIAHFNDIDRSVQIYGIENSDTYWKAVNQGNSFYKINSPTNLKIQNVDSSSVELSWNECPYVAGYRVYRSTQKTSGFEQIASISENTYTDTDLDEEKVYYYKVCVFYQNGDEVEGIPTNPVKREIKHIGEMKISYPQTIVYDGSPIEIPLTIMDGKKKLVENEDFILDIEDDDSLGWISVTITGIGKYVGSHIIQVEVIELAQPDVSVKVSGTNKLRINWKKIKGAQGYILYRSNQANSGYRKIKTLGKSTSLTYLDTKREGKKRYYYKVRAYCKKDGIIIYSPYSKVLSGVPKAGKIKLNIKKKTIKSGKSVKLRLSNVYGKIVWKSSKKSVAVVSPKGVVKGKKAGKVTITAKYAGKKYKCLVIVK